MQFLLRLSISALLAVMIVSCASTEKTPVTETGSEATGAYKYEAWRLDDSGQFDAIKVLLDEADGLIETSAYDAASDKLERALRIKPEYAPAWSRLSWLALQMDSPKRSVQMAKRSNSFAYSDTELQLLNWSFIRSASKQLNDEETYNRASQKIESLKSL